MAVVPEPTAPKNIRFRDTIPLMDLYLADIQEEEPVMRPITELERNTYNSGIVQAMIDKADIAARKKAATAQFNAEAKMVDAELNSMVGAIRSGQVRDKDVVYTFLDREQGKVRKYRQVGGKGVVQLVRSMTPAEAQMDITEKAAQA